MTYIEPIRLEPGDEVRCPRCRGWHPVVALHTEGTPYTLDMLYWECSKGRYFQVHAGPSAGIRRGDRCEWRDGGIQSPEPYDGAFDREGTRARLDHSGAGACPIPLQSRQRH